jgi:predicted MPP superfamily phosphohydrolase
VYEAQQHGIGLQLSGHTHGGQLWPFNYLVRLQQPVIKGLEKVGNVWLYVSTGTGYWGPPMRLAAPAEITRVTLASSKIA